MKILKMYLILIKKLKSILNNLYNLFKIVLGNFVVTLEQLVHFI